MFEKDILETIKRNSQKEIDINKLSREEFEKMELGWSKLARKFFEYVRTKVPEMRLMVTDEESVEFIFDVNLIKINSAFLAPQKEKELELKILNLWARYLDNKIESTINLNRLARVMVPEIFGYLVLGAGDLAEAEQCAKEEYRTRRVALLRDYSAPDFSKIKKGERDFNEIYKQKLNWGEAKARALELYNSVEAKEFCSAMDLNF